MLFYGLSIITFKFTFCNNDMLTQFELNVIRSRKHAGSKSNTKTRQACVS